MISDNLKYMIGLRFDRESERWASRGFRGWYVGFSLYWFSLMFFKRWDPDARCGSGMLCAWTGFVFYYKPNKTLKEGDMIWLHCKKWMWPDYPSPRVQ